MVVIYEQCVRAFWHDDRYKNDLRYLKVWLEYVSFMNSGLVLRWIGWIGLDWFGFLLTSSLA